MAPPRRTVLGLLGCVLVAILVATVSSTPVPRTGPEPAREPGWAAEAQLWLAHVIEARREGIPNVEQFLTPGVVYDERATGGDLAVGVDATLALLRRLDYTRTGLQVRRPAYLSPEGMVVPASWDGAGMFDVVDAVTVITMSQGGLVRAETAASLLTGRMLLPQDHRWTRLQGLADDYLAQLPRAGEAVVLDAVPGGGGPALYGIPGEEPAAFRRIVLLLRTADETDCPHRTAVTLTLGPDGHVLREDRYVRLDDGRRCPEAQVTGWWDGMEVPDAVQHVRTGTVDVDGTRVEIWNGTPALQAMVRWALRRFTAAGLALPAPKSVTFYPAADRCLGHIAVAGGEATEEIALCFGETLACRESRCPPWSARARSTLLHELAHTWLTQHLDAEVQAAYEDLVGLGWWPPDSTWEERAVEHAAESIAWGLQRDPVPPYTLEVSDADLAAGFRLLTGRTAVSLRD